MYSWPDMFQSRSVAAHHYVNGVGGVATMEETNRAVTQCRHCGEWHWTYSSEEDDGRIVFNDEGETICADCFEEMEFDPETLSTGARNQFNL